MQDLVLILSNIILLQFIFDAEEGDWAFREIKKNDHEGIEFETADTPRTADDWYFSAFNMDMVHGFSMIKIPVVVSYHAENFVPALNFVF